MSSPPPAAFSPRKDLEAAKAKTVKAGMGEWDLTNSLPLLPDRNEKILQGPLSPEILSNDYGMSLEDIYSLYENLNTWSAGFCAAITAPIHLARNREALQKLVIEAYVGLWDEAVIGTVFSSSETLGKMREMERLERAASESQRELFQTKAENEALLIRLNEFVKRQIEDNLLFEDMSKRALVAEADLAMMGKAEEQFSLSTTSAELKLISLTAQVETAALKNKELIHTLAERDAASARLKAALSESQAVCAKQYTHIVELQKALQSSQKQQLEEIEASKEARSVAAQSPLIRADLERQLSDKQIALALLRSDLSVKSHDVEELRSENARLHAELQKHQTTFESAEKRIEAAELQSEASKRELNSWKDKMASLEAENQRQSVRVRDLVKSYHPLMHRLKEAEGGHAMQVEVARKLEEEAKSLREEAMKLREVNAEVEDLRAKLDIVEREGEIVLDEEALGAMNMGAARARAFVRFTRRKIADLSTKVIGLLDSLAEKGTQGAAASSGAKEEESKGAQGGVISQERLESWAGAASVQYDVLIDQLTTLMSKDPDHPRDQTSIVPSTSTAPGPLESLDLKMERLRDCADRCMDWASVLLDSKVRVEAQLDVQATAQESKRTMEKVAEMEKELGEARLRILALEGTEEDLRVQHSLNEGLQKALESTRELLSSSSSEVASLTGRLALLEEEHFDTRSKLMMALQQRDQLVSARDRAMQEAAAATKKELEACAERDENRVMRQALELDLVGCKAWIRGIEEAERLHQKRKGELDNAKSEIARLELKVQGSSQETATISASSASDGASLGSTIDVLKSKTASAMREMEVAQEKLRHKTADCIILEKALARGKEELSLSEERAAVLKKDMWDLMLKINVGEADRRTLTDALVSSTLAKS